MSEKYACSQGTSGAVPVQQPRLTVIHLRLQGRGVVRRRRCRPCPPDAPRLSIDRSRRMCWCSVVGVGHDGPSFRRRPRPPAYPMPGPPPCQALARTTAMRNPGASTRGRMAPCRCVRSARTSRAAPTPTARRCGSATSTSRPTRRGAAPTRAPGYERRLADVELGPRHAGDAADARRAARSRRRVGGAPCSTRPRTSSTPSAPRSSPRCRPSSRQRGWKRFRRVASACDGAAGRRARVAALRPRRIPRIIAPGPRRRFRRRARLLRRRRTQRWPGRPGWSARRAGGGRALRRRRRGRRPRRRSGATAASTSSTSTASRPAPSPTTVARRRRPGSPSRTWPATSSDRHVDAADVFAELNRAFVGEPIVLARARPARPSPTRSSSTTRSAGDGIAASSPASSSRPAPDSEVTVVERFDVRRRTPGRWSCRSLELRAAQAARGRATSPSTSSGRRSGRSRTRRRSASGTRTTLLAAGRARRRLRPGAHRRRLVGRGASGARSPSTSARATRCTTSAPSRTTSAPAPTSDLLFKGAVQDRCPQRLHRADPGRPGGARGTNAFQTNRNLKLSEEAWAECVPNLEIENNDVRCSHASTVGPIDEEQRFYLESRGVPPDGGRAAHRARLLRRGARPAAGAATRARRCAATSRRQARPEARSHDAAALVTVGCRSTDLRARARRTRASRSAVAPVALVRIGDDVYAIGDRCSHANVSLSEGEVWLRRAGDRVLEARQHVLARDGRAAVAAGHQAGARLRRPGRATARSWWWCR